ncbi:MAG: hypothetical protein RLW61_18305 [Gammaproteobacteria bacterium]
MRGYALAVNAVRGRAAVEYGDDRWAILELANAEDVAQEDWVDGALAGAGQVEIYNVSQERTVTVTVCDSGLTMIEALAAAEA